MTRHALHGNEIHLFQSHERISYVHGINFLGLTVGWAELDGSVGSQVSVPLDRGRLPAESGTDRGDEQEFANIGVGNSIVERTADHRRNERSIPVCPFARHPGGEIDNTASDITFRIQVLLDAPHPRRKIIEPTGGGEDFVGRHEVCRGLVYGQGCIVLCCSVVLVPECQTCAQAVDDVLVRELMGRRGNIVYQTLGALEVAQDVVRDLLLGDARRKVGSSIDLQVLVQKRHRQVLHNVAFRCESAGTFVGQELIHPREVQVQQSTHHQRFGQSSLHDIRSHCGIHGADEIGTGQDATDVVAPWNNGH